MLFDTHAHLDADAFDGDRAELIDSLPRQGLTLVMNPGCDLPSSQMAVELADAHDFIYAAVGSHPDDAGNVTEELVERYRQLARSHPKVRAIGEIGLDYHYEDNPRSVQQRAFRMQMELARELELPVIIHDREAHEDSLKIIDEFPQVKGVFHCFSGSAEMVRELMRRDWYVGFTGVLTFKNARRAVEAAAAARADRIVIETDCPYMAPEPFRGRRNDPGKVFRMAEKLAEIRGIPLEELQQLTVENGKRLYRI